MGMLQGKVIAVIGGTTGLGLSAAKRFLAEGARVTVMGRNPENVEQARATLGDTARAIAGDAGDPQCSASAIALAQEAFGRFDALYHVAGGSGRAFGDGPLHEVTDEGIERTLSLNLSSLIASNRAAVQAFLAADRPGAILNMGSVLGFSPAPSFFSTHVYAAAKAAVGGFTKSIAAYYAPRSIRINAIAPGLFKTPMAHRAAEDAGIRSYIRTKQPLDGGRMGRPQDADGAAAFLLSDDAAFITGQVIAVDGGWTVSEGQIPISNPKSRHNP